MKEITEPGATFALFKAAPKAGTLFLTFNADYDDDQHSSGSGVPRDNLDSVSEPYIGADFPQTG
jgi:hypothetical protein